MYMDKMEISEIKKKMRRFVQIRSQSESEGLNRARLCGYSIESLRSLLKDAIIEKGAIFRLTLQLRHPFSEK